MKALWQVLDPEIHRPLPQLNMIKTVDIEGSRVRVTVNLTTGSCPLKGSIFREIKEKVAQVPGVERVEVQSIEMTPQERAALFHQRLAGVSFLREGSETRILSVASGKGGVGKSTVSVNLAVALARRGFAVGLLDADIYGFSIPRMLGVSQQPTVIDNKILPIPVHGLRMISMGAFVGEDEPVIWRGPLLGKILRQFLSDVVWGDLDYLVVDLPPGTGDVALDVASLLPRSELLLVTTPQATASVVASRAAAMARKAKLAIAGVIENMSHFICPHCGTRTAVFGEGGGRRLAAKLGVPFLGEVPLVPEVQKGGDTGRPVVLEEGSPAARAFQEIAEQLQKAAVVEA